MNPKMQGREFQGKDISLQGELPNMRLANTIIPNGISPPEHEEHAKRSFRRPEGPNMNFQGGNIRIEGPNSKLSTNDFPQKNPNISLQYDVPNFGRGGNLNLKFQTGENQMGRYEVPRENLSLKPQYDVPRFGRGPEEFSQRVDITRINNQEPVANFGRGEKVKRAGFNPNQGQEEQNNQNNQFYFNNRGGQNSGANLTGSYVRATGNRNEEYLRKTYNYYGEYRDKSTVRIYFEISIECLLKFTQEGGQKVKFLREENEFIIIFQKFLNNKFLKGRYK